jgi:hypothetical protein
MRNVCGFSEKSVTLFENLKHQRMSSIKSLHFLLFFLFPFALLAQRDSISTIEMPTDAIENLIQSTQNDNGFDLNTTFEKLEWYRKHPLDLNKASAESLQELGLLTAQQIDNLIQYREKIGKLIVIYELQAVPSFTVPVIKKILPFVTVAGTLDEYQVSLRKMLQESDNELFVRTSTYVEKTTGLTSGKYLGNSLEHYVRYRRTFGNRFSMGLTLEKDAGEPYAYAKKTLGADFISGHVRYATNKFAVILGDFGASFGQGVILMQDFSPGKSPFITDLKRMPRSLKPYTSVGEANFFRGIALNFTPKPNLEMTAFASFRQRDANLQLDTLNFFNEFTSFQTSGLHRSVNEINDKGTIQSMAFGGSLKYRQKHWNVGANVLYYHFDKKLSISPQPYNLFYFNSNQLFNASVNYSYIHRNINFFGESAMSDNGGFGRLNGLLVGLDKTLQFSALYRNYGKNFQTFFSNPVAENTGTRNEKGLYTGFVFTPTVRWKLETYADFWQNPWLRFQVDAPSFGYEYYTRLTYTIKRKLEVYAQYRNKNKQKNTTDASLLASLGTERREQYRLNLSYQILPILEWQSRIEASRVHGLSPNVATGFLAYQDLIWKSKTVPLSVTARYAIFNTTDYNSRIYAFENALMYNFSIPAYYGKGRRFYVNVRYTGIKNMMLEARIAQTYQPEVTQIGSAYDAVLGTAKTEVGVQMKVNF